MKKYTNPTVEITKLQISDVIASSGEYTITSGGDNGTVKGISWGELKDDPDIE